MEAQKKHLPITPLTPLGLDQVRQGCWVAGVIDNLGCLADGSVWPGRVWVWLGGVQSAGCLALGFLASWKVEVVEVRGPGAAGPAEMERQAGDRGGGERLAQARQRGRVSGARV